MSLPDQSEFDLISLRDLCHHLPNAVAIQFALAHDGSITCPYVSASAEKVLGIPGGAITANPRALLTVVPPEERDRLDQATSALQTGEAINLSFHLQTTSGPRKPIQLHARSRNVADGSIRIDAILIDLSATHRLEDAIRISESRFRAFMDHSPAIAWMKDADGRYVYVNRTCEDRFGILLGDWLGKTDFDVWPHDIAKGFHANDVLALTENRTVQTIEPAKDPDGSNTLWWVFKFPFTDSQERRYVGGISIEVTERERVKTELHQKNAELQQAVDRVQRLEQSLVTMCAWTRRIQMDGRWVPIEEFLLEKFGVRVSHGISEDALRSLQVQPPRSDVGAQQVKNEADRKKKPGDANPPAEPLA
jgi:PAS domain S-box-containing protein